MQLQVADRQPE